jgi:hypothetical protein
VTEIGREREEATLDVDSGPIPVTESIEGEGVPKIVEARPGRTVVAAP